MWLGAAGNNNDTSKYIIYSQIPKLFITETLMMGLHKDNVTSVLMKIRLFLTARLIS